MTQTSDTVTYEVVGQIGLIELNNPPVNACGHSIRAGAYTAIEQLNTNPAVRAIALYGAGRCFVAGADITEFGKPIAPPSMPDLCLAIENSAKPVVAVLHGATLGGGLEITLAAQARVGLSGLVTGFPEVTLGVLPGSGGTQRGPRLIGIRATLDLATSGRRIGAQEALALGLIDRHTEGAPREVALQAAQEMLDGALPTRRTAELTVAPDDAALAEYTEALQAKQGHLFSPHKIVEAIARSTGDFSEGMAAEREAFFECIESPQRAGLIHAFFAERAVAKIPESNATARDVSRIGVVGGGLMGSGIATAALLSGLGVTLREVAQDGLDRARASIEANLAGAVKRGKLTPERRDALLKDALTLTTEPSEFAACDVVIEAVFEDMAVKKDVLRAVEPHLAADAIFATNTSYLDLDEIASAAARPENVLGLHFFSPAHVMRLLEVVVGAKTAPEVVATGFALGKRLRKVAVRAGVCDGFIGNRILNHYRKVADYMVLDGASPAQVDRAITRFGFAMGPFAVADLAGLEIGWATRKRRAPTRPPQERYVEIADRICERGWFGRKTGRGYYLYGEETGETPEVAQIIAEERARVGVRPREFSDAEIVERYMTAMVTEAIRVLEDGIALRPLDIDAVFLFGYGFPRFRGGPMHYADTVGAAELVARIERFAAEDPHYWQVPKLMRTHAESGRSFAELNG